MKQITEPPIFTCVTQSPLCLSSVQTVDPLLQGFSCGKITTAQNSSLSLHRSPFPLSFPYLLSPFPFSPSAFLPSFSLSLPFRFPFLPSHSFLSLQFPFPSRFPFLSSPQNRARRCGTKGALLDRRRPGRRACSAVNCNCTNVQLESAQTGWTRTAHFA